MELPEIKIDLFSGSRYFRRTLKVEAPIPKGAVATGGAVVTTFYMSPGVLNDPSAFAAMIPMAEESARKQGAVIAEQDGIVGPYEIRLIAGDLRPNPLAAWDADEEETADHNL